MYYWLEEVGFKDLFNLFNNHRWTVCIKRGIDLLCDNLASSCRLLHASTPLILLLTGKRRKKGKRRWKQFSFGSQSTSWPALVSSNPLSQSIGSCFLLVANIRALWASEIGASLAYSCTWSPLKPRLSIFMQGNFHLFKPWS